MGCITKAEPGDGDKAQQGENILNNIVPQYLSKKSRAGPVTVSRFSQKSGSSESIVMSKNNQEVRLAQQEGMWPSTCILTTQVTQGPRPRV